jgi:hypothetical protein
MDHRPPPLRGFPLLAGLLAGSLVLALSSFAEQAAAPHPSVLAGAAALEKPVTYSETKIPLGELVQKVAADTGVKLTAARDVADEPVAVVVKQMPARELLEQLAQLLDYRWSRHSGVVRRAYSVSDKGGPASDPSGYEIRNTHSAPTPTFEIWQDLAGKQREASLRRAAIAGVEARFQRALEALITTASLPPEEIQQIIDETEQRWRERQKLPPEEQLAPLSSPEEQERGRRWSAARQVRPPISRAMARLLGQLTPEQWARLREDGSLAFSSDPSNGVLPLPEETARAFRASQPGRDPKLLSSDPNFAELMRKQLQSARDAWAAATGYRVGFRLDASQIEAGGSLSLNAWVTPLRSGGPALRFVGDPSTGLGLNVDPRDSEARWAEDTPQRRAALAKDPLLGAQKPFKPQVKSHPSPYDRPGPAWRLQELLPDIARTYDVDFLSDAYWTSPFIFADDLPTAEKPALFTLLDRVAADTHRWERRGNLIRLRSRTWASDRPREIPLRFVSQWRKSGERYGALPLAQYLEMATGLTDPQLAQLGQLLGTGVLPPSLTGLDVAYRARGALRLYAALAVPQRQVLDGGHSVPCAQMTAPQRALFAAALQALKPAPHPALLPGALPWDQAAFAVKRSMEAPKTGAGAVVLPGRTEAAAPPLPNPASGKEAARPPVARLEFDLSRGSAGQESVSIAVAWAP